jgi:hypothetical protein
MFAEYQVHDLARNLTGPQAPKEGPSLSADSPRKVSYRLPRAEILFTAIEAFRDLTSGPQDFARKARQKRYSAATSTEEIPHEICEIAPNFFDPRG